MTEIQILTEIVNDTVTAWNIGNCGRFMVLYTFIVALAGTAVLCALQDKNRTPIKNFAWCLAGSIYLVLEIEWIMYCELSGMAGRVEWFPVFIILELCCVRYMIRMVQQLRTGHGS